MYNQAAGVIQKVKCFGNRAALCAEATSLLPKDEEQGIAIPTVNLELAPRGEGGAVQWGKKIVIQLSEGELPLACAVTLGYIPKLELKRPGKGIDIIRQSGNLFIRASAGSGQLYILPITVGDTFRLSTLFLSRLQLQSGLDGTLIVAALRGSMALLALPS